MLTALEVEFRSVAEFLMDRSSVSHPLGTAYELGTLPTSGGAVAVAVGQVGSGNVRAAIEAERALTFFSSELFVFVGVAGGIKDVQIGDVVAATRVYGYESGKDATEFLTRPDVGETSYSFQQCAMDVSRSDRWQQRIAPRPRPAPRAFIGPIAAGEKVVSSARSPTFLLLRQRFGDALAVEMEGRGTLAGAFAHTHVATGVVRGISDLIEHKEDADASGSQRLASAHAAGFAMEVIATFSRDTVVRGKEAPAPSREPEWWAGVSSEASRLYPAGPCDHDIWIRGGGDLASLPLQGEGRTQWERALRLLKHGGGGASISAVQLLSVMLEDFPRNAVLKRLLVNRPKSS